MWSGTICFAEDQDNGITFLRSLGVEVDILSWDPKLQVTTVRARMTEKSFKQLELHWGRFVWRLERE